MDGLEEPDPNVWYGFGRIAEQFGMYDAATSAYRPVGVPEDRMSIQDSTYLLAQRRIKMLQESISAVAK